MDYRKHDNDEQPKPWGFEGAYHKTVIIPNFLMNGMRDIVKKRGFSNLSDFIRYAIRKELEFQLGMIYLPQIKEKD